MLKVNLFGAGRVHYNDQTLAGFPHQQAYWLFCYLILNRATPQSRDRLAATFWGDLPGATARKSLRNALWRLRQSLLGIGAPPDDYLAVGDDSVCFTNTNAYWLDTAAFENAITATRDTPGETLTPEQADQIETAVELYTGDLLDGIYEDWCLHERERLNLLHLSALQKLVAYHGACGTYERGLMYGERILARDLTREKVHRQMMRLYWLAGDRNAALAQYKRCAQILREELGAAPMEETTRLYDLMVSNRYRPDEPASLDLRPRREAADPRLTHQALERVQRLRAVLEETRAELSHLENLLGATLLEV
jgi:DNA-binding SARP family transcriptional activator